MSYDGEIIWGRSLEGCAIRAPCVIGDASNFFGEFGEPEVYVGTSGKAGPEAYGYIYSLRASTGETIWQYQLTDPNRRWGCNGLAIGDIDWDGDLELTALTRAKPGQDHLYGELLVFDAEWGGNPEWDYDIFGLGTISPALGDITGDESLEVISGGSRSDADPGEDAIYCWDASGSLIWSVGTRNYSNLYGSLASVVLASFSPTSSPDFCVLANAQDGQENPQARLWLLDADDGSIESGYPQEIYGESRSTPALMAGLGDSDMDFSVGSCQDAGEDQNRVIAYDADVLNDSANIEWGMYYHDPKHTGRHAQPVSGTINTDVAWYGRYIVWGDVTVASGATLRIEPSTRIEVKDGYKILVQSGGQMIIEGWETYPVVFTAYSDNPSAGDWFGIQALSGSDIYMTHCTIKHAEFGIWAGNASTLVVENCTIEDNLTAGIYMENAPNGTTIANSRIEDSGTYGIYCFEGSFTASGDTIANNRYGIDYWGDGNLTIEDCLITYPSPSAISSYYGIRVRKYSATGPRPRVSGDSITGFDQGGIYFDGVTKPSSIISATSVYKSGKSGIYFKSSSADISGGTGTRNFLKENGYGLALHSSSSPKVRRTKFEDNSIMGSIVSAGCSPDFGTSMDAGNNSFIKNGFIGTYKHLCNYNILPINAIKNYWSPLYPYLIFNANYFPPLATDPLLPKIGRDWDRHELAEDFGIAKVYPNPFNPATTIEYTLPEASLITIEIYDILGRKIETLVDEELAAGYHQIVWDASDHSSGLYFYRIQAGDYAETKKMVLLK